jgi:hypothetical protein
MTERTFVGGGPLPSVSLAQQKTDNMIGAVAAHRLLGLAAAPEQLIKIGAAFPLLAEIILRCGSEIECTLNLQELTGKLGTGHTTLKSWLRKLAAIGCLTRSVAGNRGVKVVLNGCAIPATSVFDDGQHEVEKARALLRSIREVVDRSVDGALQQLSNKGES